MNSKFKISEEMISKSNPQKYTVISTDPSKNKVYDFQGLSAEVLEKLFSLKTFTLDNFLSLSQSSLKEDQDQLWKFLIDEKIIIPA
jgi:nitrogenase subunit NifH